MKIYILFEQWNDDPVWGDTRTIIGCFRDKDAAEKIRQDRIHFYHHATDPDVIKEQPDDFVIDEEELI